MLLYPPSTIHLISSIQQYAGAPALYDELSTLSSADLDSYDSVVLCLIDALGYHWIEQYAPDSFLARHMRGSLQSVFPSTTATAVTTFATGGLASDHGVMGWNMYSRESGGLIQILPWRHKVTGSPLGDRLSAGDLISMKGWYSQAQTDTFVVTADPLRNTKCNTHYNSGAKVLTYSDLGGFFSQIEQAVRWNAHQKVVSAYWGDFDSISHEYGIESKELMAHFQDLDHQFSRLIERLSGTKSFIIVTADHGQISVGRRVNLSVEYPHISRLLSLPLAGEPRCQFAFVRADQREAFSQAVKKDLSEICEIYTREEVLKQGIFGTGRDERFLSRLGDFVLIMRENHILYDDPRGEIYLTDIGVHGGMHPWETTVPLIVMEV